jgi:hypothetical protein
MLTGQWIRSQRSRIHPYLEPKHLCPCWFRPSLLPRQSLRILELLFIADPSVLVDRSRYLVPCLLYRLLLLASSRYEQAL